LLACPLDDLLDLSLGHGGADLSEDEAAAATIEDAAQMVERPGDVELKDVRIQCSCGFHS
jgi:hypothetical protein